MQTSKTANPSADDTLLIQPKILYYGTPVVLLTTLNEDGSTNISPISSSWALGNHIVLGIGLGGKAAENLQRCPECVINLPDPSMWEQVEQLASVTGKSPVPHDKAAQGFTYQKDKFTVSGLTPHPRMPAANRSGRGGLPSASQCPLLRDRRDPGRGCPRPPRPRHWRTSHRPSPMEPADIQLPPLLRPRRTVREDVSGGGVSAGTNHSALSLQYSN